MLIVFFFQVLTWQPLDYFTLFRKIKLKDSSQIAYFPWDFGGVTWCRKEVKCFIPIWGDEQDSQMIPRTHKNSEVHENRELTNERRRR